MMYVPTLTWPAGSCWKLQEEQSQRAHFFSGC